MPAGAQPPRGARLADGSVVTTLSEEQLIEKVTPQVVGVEAGLREAGRGLSLSRAVAIKILAHFDIAGRSGQARPNVIRLVNILRGLFDLDPHAAEGAEAAAVASGAAEGEAEDQAQEQQQEEETEETVADRMRKRRRHH